MRRIVVLVLFTHISLRNVAAGAPGENDGVIREEGEGYSSPKPNLQSLRKGRLLPEYMELASCVAAAKLSRLGNCPIYLLRARVLDVH
ncbi:hypothetical protein EDD22DRAFT_912126 [Suillus occidentalis]|nr:hypothetical protein EDD22DRAFT_918386 [Suillus occidentalis]KAG1758161.1 hypothetical protein EDD22DRAFT_912126 [Suillus occidentalis]